MGASDSLPPYPSQADVLARLQSFRQFGPYEPGAVQTLPNWGMPTKPATVTDPMFKARNVGHEAILGGAIDGIDVDGIDKGRAAVKKVADDVDEAYTTFIREIGAALGAQWKGETGQAAAQSISGYAGKAVQLVEAGYATSRNLDSLGGVMSYTKSNVPRVPDQGGWDLATSWLPWSHHHEAEKDQAKAQAQEFMDTNYFGHGVQPTAATLTAMPAAQSPIGGNDNPSSYQPGGTGGGPGGTGGVPGGPGVAAPGGPGDPNGPGNNANPPTNSGDQGGSNQSQGAGKPSTGASGDPNKLAAAGYDPTIGSGAGLGGDAGLGGGAAGLGGGAGGAGDGAGGPLTSPLLGGSGGTSAATGRPGAMGAGRPGAAGVGGMPPGAGGKKKEDEKTHRTKEYPGLYGTHNLEELFETVDGRKVSPPVLGVWSDDEHKSE